VEAIQVTDENIEEVARWCMGTLVDHPETENASAIKYVKVRVHHPMNERQTKAFVGDWVLYAKNGYKVYTQKAFEAAFDKEIVYSDAQSAAHIESSTSPTRNVFEQNAG